MEARAEVGPAEPDAALPLQAPQLLLSLYGGGIEDVGARTARYANRVGPRRTWRVEGHEKVVARQTLQAVHPIGDVEAVVPRRYIQLAQARRRCGIRPASVCRTVRFRLYRKAPSSAFSRAVGSASIARA